MTPWQQRSQQRRLARNPELRKVLQGAGVGLVTIHFVPERWVDALDEKIALLHADVAKHYAAKGPNPAEPSNGWWPFQTTWNLYEQVWQIWKMQHETAKSRTGEAAEKSFYKKRDQYNKLLTQFTQTEKGKTEAKQDKPMISPPPAHEKPGPGGGYWGDTPDWVPAAVVGVLGVAALVFALKGRD